MSELTSEHLDDFTLLLYVAEDLSEFERARVGSHLDRCSDCRASLQEIEELDGGMRAIAGDLAQEERRESMELPPGDPFARRPEGPPRQRPPRQDRERLPEIALAASEEARPLQAEILEAMKDARSLSGLLESITLVEARERYALLYALQEAGREIGSGPVRALRFAETTLERLRRAPSAPPGDPNEFMVPGVTLIGQAHVLAGSACNWTGQYENGRAHLEIAYRAFGHGAWDEVSLAQVEFAEAQRRFFIGGGAESLALARRAGQTFREYEMEDNVARAEVAQAMALSKLGRHDEAIALLRRAIPIFEKQGLWSLYVAAVNGLAVSLLDLNRVGEARREYARALRRASQNRQRAWVPFIQFGLARVLHQGKRFREAAVSFSRAARVFVQEGLLARALTSSLMEIESWAANGDLQRARQRLDIFRAEVARHHALDPTTTQAIAQALSGDSPDFEKLAALRQQAELILQERLPATA